MKRRAFLQAAGAGAAAALAAPRIARADEGRVLKFIPQSDVTVLDPVWTTAYVTRNHGYMIFDTLYGTDGDLTPSPQMVAGDTVEDDGRRVTLRLRDGLEWHDGEPVLARDCVASIQRWAKRDTFGQTLMAVTDEISAPGDNTIMFRLKKPFPLLQAALGKSPTNFCAMMPERLAMTDPFKQVTEMVGSGPYKFVAGERVPGHLLVYERFADYRPRQSGGSDWTAGPKVAHFDRVEWHVIQDPATAAAALESNEVDWWENPTNDLLPLLRRNGHIRVQVQDPTGLMGCMRLNHLTAPFDNPGVRRALLKAISQEDFTLAVAGDDPKMSHVPTGLFCPNTPMATEAGLEVFTGTRDYDAVKKEMAAAGYKGEKVVLLAPSDIQSAKMLADISNDVMRKIGLNVDYQAMDWATLVQRRAKKDPVERGGWSVFHTSWSGIDQANPVGHVFLRGNGEAATVGWPSSPRIEELRTQWLQAPDLAAQKKIAEAIQLQAFQDVPYIPLGQYFIPTAYRADLTGMLDGSPVFWNLRRAA
jgi:peptide/nickel transport system substrate-binding protein